MKKNQKPKNGVNGKTRKQLEKDLNRLKNKVTKDLKVWRRLYNPTAASR